MTYRQKKSGLVFLLIGILLFVTVTSAGGDMGLENSPQTTMQMRFLRAKKSHRRVNEMADAQVNQDDMDEDSGYVDMSVMNRQESKERNLLFYCCLLASLLLICMRHTFCDLWQTKSSSLIWKVMSYVENFDGKKSSSLFLFG